ncbi:response regulator [Piscinibacter sp.]|uniref:response regulator n=1 Tax=Piscinibacter sp. TaxID=1903157 RepID=UPI00258BFA25|nr:response regulator [Piscinibacter sp.]
MHPLDGVQTLERLRTLYGEALPPALLVSAHDDDRMWRQSRAAGFGAVLLKPASSSSLHDTLLSLLRAPAVAAVEPLAPGRSERLLRERHAGARVLLAEDNPINREVAVELLGAAGLRVDTAQDGAEALHKALAGGIDLVLMDMQMPELDGLEATRRLRAAGLASLPVVAMTANAFGEDRAACLAAGMNDHVAKPVDPEKLYATLLHWLPAPATAAAPAAPEPAAPVPVPAPLQDRLAALDGFDVGQAMRSVGGQPALLARVLTHFAAAYRQGCGALDRHGVHSLRGACAAVGATQLHDTLLALERRLPSDAAPVEAGEAAAIDTALRTLVARLEAELAR